MDTPLVINTTLKERVDTLLRLYKIKSPRQLAINVGMDTSQFNKALRGEIGLPYTQAKKISEQYPDVTIEWIKEGKGADPVVRTNNPDYLNERRDLKLKGKNRIPFYDAEAAASDIAYSEMTAVSAPAGTIDIGDLLGDSHAAIRIYGNSMIPNYPPGCVVGLAKCNGCNIEPGEVYVIETRDRRILKRLFYPDDDSRSDSVTCYSDNTLIFKGGARDGKLAYPPFEISKEEILNLYIVTGVIKRNANSVIIQNKS